MVLLSGSHSPSGALGLRRLGRLGVYWGREEKMGSCSEVGAPGAEDFEVAAAAGARAAGGRVLAPALPCSSQVTSGQSFHPSGGFFAHKIRGLEEVIFELPSSLLSVILKQTCWAYRECVFFARC